MLAILALPTVTRASTIIAPGWDLLQTDPAVTTVYGVAFEGVSLNTFDFGGAIGLGNVASTDTILRRLGEASAPGPGSSATIPIVVDALQLRSTAPVSILGGPLGVYYLTLASQRGGPSSTGTETINFGPEGEPHGTFSSSLNLFVDFRLGSLDGPILDSRNISISDSGSVPWGHEAAGSIQISGVNLHLNGSDSSRDFWMDGALLKQAQDFSFGWRNTGSATGVPESGSSLALLTLALSALARNTTSKVGDDVRCL